MAIEALIQSCIGALSRSLDPKSFGNAYEPQISAFLNSPSFRQVTDHQGNLIFLSPKGRFLVLTLDKRLLTGQIGRPLINAKVGQAYYAFLNDKTILNTGRGNLSLEDQLALIMAVAPSELELDLTHNLIEVNRNDFFRPLSNSSEKLDPTLPVVKIDLSYPSPYSSIDWTSYLDKEVNVVFRKNGQDRVVTQRVFSLESFILRNPRLEQSIQKLTTSNSSSFLPEYQPEVGMFVLFDQVNLLESDMFSSGSFHQIAPEQVGPALYKVVEKSLTYPEEEGLFNHVAILHSHPIKDAPLSPADNHFLNILGEDLWEKPDDDISIIAITDGLVFIKTYVHQGEH